MDQPDVKSSTAEEVYCQLCCQGVKVSKLCSHPVEKHSIVNLHCPFSGCPLVVNDFHQRAFTGLYLHFKDGHRGKKLTKRQSDDLDEQKRDARKRAELAYMDCFPGVSKVVVAKQPAKQLPGPSAVMPSVSQKQNLPPAVESKTQSLPRATYLDPSITHALSSSVPLSTRSENALRLAGSSCAVCHKFVPFGERWRHVEQEHTKVLLSCPYRSSPFVRCRFGISHMLYREAYDEYIAHMEDRHDGLTIAPHHPYGVIMDYTEQLQKNRSAVSEDHRKCFPPSPNAETQSMRRKRRREELVD